MYLTMFKKTKSKKKKKKKKKKKTVFNNLHIDSFVIPFFQLNL